MKVLVVTWVGVVLTFVGTALLCLFSPGPLPLAEQAWMVAMCAVAVAMLFLVYQGRPRDLANGLPAPVRAVAGISMLLSGGAWGWLMFRSVTAPDAELFAVRVQRTVALFVCAASYYLFAQRPRQ